MDKENVRYNVKGIIYSYILIIIPLLRMVWWRMVFISSKFELIIESIMVLVGVIILYNSILGIYKELR